MQLFIFYSREDVSHKTHSLIVSGRPSYFASNILCVVRVQKRIILQLQRGAVLRPLGGQEFHCIFPLAETSRLLATPPRRSLNASQVSFKHMFVLEFINIFAKNVN